MLAGWSNTRGAALRQPPSTVCQGCLEGIARAKSTSQWESSV